jgi:hypothetical protein
MRTLFELIWDYSDLPEVPNDVAQQIAAGNAGWPFQFRYRGGPHQRVPELWTLG